jgi:GT2 family glycosyltransferase
MNSGPKLSVIILCYRSGQSIVDFFDRTKALVAEAVPSHEFVLVANYLEESDDRTGEFAEEIASQNPNCTLVSNPKKRDDGLGYAPRIRCSKGRRALHY